MAHSSDIVAYMYAADFYCPNCIISKVTGIAYHLDESETIETALDSVAAMRGIDREDEATFDSGDFPKVVLRGQLEDDEYCGNCHNQLGDD